MERTTLPLRDAQAFSAFFLRYIEGDAALKSFYENRPEPEHFANAIRKKEASFPAGNRALLADALIRQYDTLPVEGPVGENIARLRKPGTFTVTTGHQLNIFTGPLYFIYKIATVINACEELKKAHPNYDFVPVYWMASEDHDYEEIKYFRLYGKKYVWETAQTGAVGRFNTRDFPGLLSSLPGDVSMFQTAYTKNNTLAAAVRHYVHTLFAHKGLVVMDADDASLKSLLTPVVEDDLFAHTPFQRVSATNTKLKELGFDPQVNPREINFFYLEDKQRNRIETKGNEFAVVDSPLTFSQDQMRQLIQDHPERFSPNVILRPVYQELILPNLAYVGGPAELVYWLQLKDVFTHFKVPFPILLPRNYALVIDAATGRKLDKTGLKPADFFHAKNEIASQWVKAHAGHSLSTQSELIALQTIMKEVEDRAARIDPTLKPMVEASTTRMVQSLERIEKKMVRAEKRRHEDKLRQIEEVKDALFPDGGLQERTDNFLNFYQQDPGFINAVLKHLRPFDFQFHILRYE